jgi:prepilin-type N-terminal cleavage/methylation domain-containing protein
MRRNRAVSLIELIVAVVILGLVALLAIPRLTRAAPPPDRSAALKTQLKTLRCAVERYYQDHGTYPGCSGDAEQAAGTPAALSAQLCLFTDPQGQVSATRDATHRFGPYLRDGMPANPVLPESPAGVDLVRGTALLAPAPDAPEAGWIYDCDTGRLIANTPAADPKGQPYSTY